MFPKYSISLFFLALAFTVTGQQLPRGTFILSTGYTYTEFTFKNKAKFDYKYTSCTGEQKGQGAYTFRNKELVLIFDNPKKKFLPPVVSLIRQEPKSNTCYLSFRFFNQKDLKPVGAVVAKFRKKSDGVTYGLRSTEAGQLILKMKSDEFPVAVEINCTGTISKSISFDTVGNYSIEYPLNFEHTTWFIKGDSLRFIINEFDDDKLVLKPNGEKEFRTFTRKTE